MKLMQEKIKLLELQLKQKEAGNTSSQKSSLVKSPNSYHGNHIYIQNFIELIHSM